MTRSRFHVRDRRLGGVRAAEYVRMSTEHQKYSIANQRDAIARYAAERSLCLVRTYEDYGRSGLTFEKRPGLRQLITDIETGAPGFDVVLIYDVSRWGRFQDADESAFYEYRCRRAGVDVEYIAEGFHNDGTIGADLHKVVKRRMAAEFSRELSVKSFVGQRRIVELGYRAGGRAGYGLRRLLVDENGTPKQLLEHGQLKNVQSDRVVLVPGPNDEVKTVRSIFRTYAAGCHSQSRIARDLNARGVAGPRGGAWTERAVRSILRNEKYVGRNVWNQTDQKMGDWRGYKPASQVVRVDGAFEPLIDVGTFEAVRERLAVVTRIATDEEVIARMRALLERHGRLTGRLLENEPSKAGASVAAKRFGGMMGAYARIGYKPARALPHFAAFRRLRDIRRAILAEVAQKLEAAGVEAVSNLRGRFIQIGTGARVAFAFTARQYTAQGRTWWQIHPPRRHPCDVVVAVCVREPSDSKPALFMFAREERSNRWELHIRESSPPSGVQAVMSVDELVQQLLRGAKVAPRHHRNPQDGI